MSRGINADPDVINLGLFSKLSGRDRKMLPKRGRIFRNGSGDKTPRVVYARAIRDALRGELGSTHRANKIIRQWTGAGERTVKNWFSGQYGPSGEHLLVLARHSHEVLHTMLVLMERQDLLVGQEIIDIEGRIARLVMLVEEIKVKSR